MLLIDCTILAAKHGFQLGAPGQMGLGRGPSSQLLFRFGLKKTQKGTRDNVFVCVIGAQNEASSIALDRAQAFVLNLEEDKTHFLRLRSIASDCAIL